MEEYKKFVECNLSISHLVKAPFEITSMEFKPFDIEEEFEMKKGCGTKIPGIEEEFTCQKYDIKNEFLNSYKGDVPIPENLQINF